jgi:hypothetical protein
MNSYRGSCHCGRVTFEVRAELDYVVDCNCAQSAAAGVRFGRGQGNPTFAS